MAELKVAQLLHHFALRCPETTALLKLEWLEGALKLPINLYVFNPDSSAKTHKNPKMVWPDLDFPKSTPKGTI